MGYIDWLLSINGGLRWESVASMLWFFVVATLFLAMCWAIYLRFFCLPSNEEVEKNILRYGELASPGKLYLISGVILAPFVEELAFRGPVLWFFLNGDLWLAFGVILASALLFGLAHLTEPVEHVGGAKTQRPWADIWNSCVGGLFYAVAVLVTGSLWSAIMLHSLWNLSVSFCPEDGRLVQLARSMRR